MFNFVAVDILYLKQSTPKLKRWNTYSQQPEMYSITKPDFHCFGCLCVYVNHCRASVQVPMSLIPLVDYGLPPSCRLQPVLHDVLRLPEWWKVDRLPEWWQSCLGLQLRLRWFRVLLSAQTQSLDTTFSQWKTNHCIFPIAPFPSDFFLSSTMRHAGPAYHLPLSMLL